MCHCQRLRLRYVSRLSPRAGQRSAGEVERLLHRRLVPLAPHEALIIEERHQIAQRRRQFVTLGLDLQRGAGVAVERVVHRLAVHGRQGCGADKGHFTAVPNRSRRTLVIIWPCGLFFVIVRLRNARRWLLDVSNGGAGNAAD